MKRFLILPVVLSGIAASILGLPPAVTDLAVDPGASTPTGIALTWTAPDEWNSDGDITVEPLLAGSGSETLVHAIEYDLRYSSVDPAGSSTLEKWFDEIATPAVGEPVPGTPGDTETFLIDELNSGQTYWCAIRVIFGDSAASWSALSNLVDGQTGTDSNPPDVVTTLSASQAGEGSINLSWTAPADDAGQPGSGAVDRYEIRVSTIGPITPGLFDNTGHCSPVEPPPAPLAPGTAQQFTVSGLDSGTVHWFALKAIDDGENEVLASASPSATTGVGGTSDASGGREICSGGTSPGMAGLALLVALLFLPGRRIAG